MKTRKKSVENIINVKLTQLTLLQRRIGGVFKTAATAANYRLYYRRKLLPKSAREFSKFMENSISCYQSLITTRKCKTRRRSCDRNRWRRQNTPNYVNVT